MTCSFDNSFKELVSRNRAIIMGVAMILVVLYHQNFENEGLLWDFFHRYGYWGAGLFLFQEWELRIHWRKILPVSTI